MERERKFIFYETVEDEEDEVYTYNQDGLIVIGIAKSYADFMRMVEQIKNLDTEEGEGEA